MYMPFFTRDSDNKLYKTVLAKLGYIEICNVNNPIF